MKKRIDELCQGGFWRGKSEPRVIDAIERLLGVVFPADYRYFLSTYGSGSKQGVEIAGVDPILISDGNVLARTILQLREYRHYPPMYIFFSDTGDGGQIAFDRNDWSVHEVYARRPKALEDKKVAINFSEFLGRTFS